MQSIAMVCAIGVAVREDKLVQFGIVIDYRVVGRRGGIKAIGKRLFDGCEQCAFLLVLPFPQRLHLEPGVHTRIV